MYKRVGSLLDKDFLQGRVLRLDRSFLGTRVGYMCVYMYMSKIDKALAFE